MQEGSKEYDVPSQIELILNRERKCSNEAFENLLWIFLLHIYGTPFLQLFSSDWTLFFLRTPSLEHSVSTQKLGMVSLVGSIHWTNNVRTNNVRTYWWNIWTVLDTIEDAMLRVADFKEFFANTCMILPSFWMLAQLSALKLNTCLIVILLHHSYLSLD